MEKAFKELLHDNLFLDNEPVSIIPRYPRSDETPCISIQVADETFIRRRYMDIRQSQYIVKKYNCDLWINVWANTNKQRNNLIKQVKKRILQAESNHYTTCKYYHEDNCEITEDSCDALSKNTGRTNKQQCPNLNKYTSFFKNNHIIKNTFYINSITDLDESDISEPLLRTIFRLNFNYNQYYQIGGRVFDEIHIDEELL